MKIPRTAVAIVLLFLIAIVLFTQILTQQEERKKNQDFQNKGLYLISLISLYPLSDFITSKRDFFLRTLSEYTSNEGFFYFFVHDQTGQTLISLAPMDLAHKIPAEVQTKSLYTLGLTIQKVEIAGSRDRVYEFSKPLFEGGNKTGTVRLGLRVPPPIIFSLERLSLLAVIAFFILASITLVYYSITHALKPLGYLHQRFRSNFLETPSSETPSKDKNPSYNGQISPIIDSLERSLIEIHDKLNHIKRDNYELTSKLGVTTFEKNQILTILDSLNFGIILTDMQNNITHINEYMLCFLGQKRSEVMNRSVTEILIHPEIISFISQYEAIGHAKAESHLEISLPEVGQGEIFQLSMSYLHDVQKIPISKMISYKRITGEKMAENAKHEFITRVAHELLTPLTNIRSYSEMLMDGEVKDSDTQKEFYNTINQETNRLSRLIRNLLDISKIEMGSLIINKGLVRTDWLLDDCLMTVESSALDKKIAIEKILPDKFPTLMADKELLKTAIINILGNAVKYTPTNGKITFSISEQDKMVIFDITDTGYGITDKDLPNIFERFYRSEDPCITEQSGSGLGLAITKEIVHLHDGEIEVQSQVGEGTHFSIKIPIEEFYLG